MRRFFACGLALSIVGVACGSSDVADTVTPATAAVSEAPDAATTPTDAGQPVGFGRVAAEITTATGETCQVCLWLADTSDRRSRGLMGVTDLGSAAGMAFVHAEPHTGTFHMTDTLLPLSIAFFDASGAYMASFEMQPCADDPCRRHLTPNNFTVAVEVPQGRLQDLGLADGSSLSLLDAPCDET